MKNLFLIIFTILTSLTGFAQITQETKIANENKGFTEFTQLETAGVKFYIMDEKKWTITVYNTDYTVFNSIKIDTVGLLTGYPNVESMLYPYCISQHLFDPDEGIEFLLFLYAYNATSDQLIKTVIVDDNGSIMFSKTNQSPASDLEDAPQFPSWIKNTPHGTKMLLKDKSTGDIYVYKLPGTIPCYSCSGTPEQAGVLKSSQTTSLASYPNPANAYTTIEYSVPEGESNAEIIITSTKGQVIKSYKVNNNSQSIRISTQNLKNGEYLYNLKTNNGIYAGKKLIIKK